MTLRRMPAPIQSLATLQPAVISGVDRIAVCGLGLIGGSVVRALRAAGHAGRITGLDIDAALVRRVKAEGWIDAAAEANDALFADHDLVVLCQPVGALLDFVERHAAAMAQGRAVVLDVASVKSPVAAMLRGQAAAARFVPSHPIAGKALHGWDASEAGLFAGKRCILTPDAATEPAAIARASDFWSLLGCQVSTMQAEDHDAIYAAISHLPQVLTYAYLHSLGSREDAGDWPAYKGSGFSGFTRLGSSDSDLWADIAIHNRKPLIHEIDCLSDALALMRHQLSVGDAAALAESFEMARRFHAQSSAPVDGPPA